jgi:coproporphyrinogen III oxidase
MEEMEERHQVEIKVYKQKVKHLLYEHQNNITTLKADGELALKLQQDEFRKREGELGRDKRDLKLKIKEQVGHSFSHAHPNAHTMHPRVQKKVLATGLEKAEN